MALTRKMLRDMGLEPAQVSEIIAAHLDSLDAAKATAAAESAALNDQLTAAQAEAQQAQDNLAAYQAEVTRKDKVALLRQALIDAGANPAAAPLMAASVDLDALALENGALVSVSETIDALKSSWAELFTSQSVQPLPHLNPQVNGPAVLTRQDIDAMSLEDINRHWSAVSSALRDQL